MCVCSTFLDVPHGNRPPRKRTDFFGTAFVIVDRSIQTLMGISFVCISFHSSTHMKIPPYVGWPTDSLLGKARGLPCTPSKRLVPGSLLTPGPSTQSTVEG